LSEQRTKHLEALTVAFFANLERHHDCEYGSIGLDCKRPFGNSDVEGDILEIIEMEMQGDDGDGPCWSSKQRDYAGELYDSLPNFIRSKYLPVLPERFAWRAKFNKV